MVDLKEHRPLMPIGTMRTPGPVELDTPIFDMRHKYLELIKEIKFQVLIDFLGELVWVNVNKSAVNLFDKPVW